MHHMTEEMRIHLGYDYMGNNPTLLCESDRKFIEEVGVPRASADVVCKCNLAYRLHPRVQGALYFTRTCEGIVKL